MSNWKSHPQLTMSIISRMFKPPAEDKFILHEAHENFFKQIRDEIRGKTSFSRYNADADYNGHIGQEFFLSRYPEYEPTENRNVFVKDTVDAYHPRLRKTIEVKTGGGSVEWRNGFSVGLDYDAWNYKPCDIAVFCHYHIPTRTVRICGWNWRSVLDSHESKQTIKHGEDAYNKWGTRMFTVQNPTAFIMWDSSVLLPMKDLWDAKPI